MTKTPPRTKTDPANSAPVELELVIRYLAGSIGVEKARSVVLETLKMLNVPPTPILEASCCASLLEKLAAQQGLIGIAARVTKIKLQLRVSPAQ